MAAYARKACSNCGILLPQPEMLQREVTPLGVRGNALPSRLKWFCSLCAPPTAEEIWRDNFQREKAIEEAARERDRPKRQAWREEQERRRLANVARRAAET